MSGEIETTADDTEEGQIVSRWLREISLSSAHEREWRKRARDVIKRYRDERDDSENNRKKFNILYANTEVLRGVIYQRPPVPDVRRRFLAKDPVGREASQVLQRALSFCADSYDYDAVMECVVEDYLLPGRSMAKVRYVPTYGPLINQDGEQVIGEDGQPVQQVIYETVEADYVEWDMVRISPAKRWSKVRWVAFGELLTRDELVQQFGDLGRSCALDWSPKDKEKDEDIFKRALVWSIWDKQSRKVHVISKGLPGQRLKVVDDPLGLKDFFPCPAPIYSIRTNGNMVPIPEYCQYQDQAIELDTLTERISALVDALRRRGVYDSSFPEIQKLANAGDNEFIAVEKFSNLAEKGGLEKALYESPIEGIAAVLVRLYQQRDQVKSIIYEETGIADIVRGVSSASETLGAQQLKARYANSRISPRQKAIQVMARDLFRIKAEIIAEKFSPETLMQMTGIELPRTEQEKAAMQAVRPDDPMLKKPSWEAVINLLRNEKLRGFQVDIETDSTIEPDASEEQKNRVEFLSAVTNFVQTITPAVQGGAIPMETAKEMLSFGVRGFKVSPQMEDALDAIGGNQESRAKDEEEAKSKKDMAEQMQIRKQQAELAEIEANAAEAAAKAREAAAQAELAEIELSGKRQLMAIGGMPQIPVQGVV